MSLGSADISKARARGLAAVCAVAGLSVLAAGCGGSSKDSKSAPNATTPATQATTSPSAAPLPKVNKVAVNVSDTKLALSSTSFKPGNYTFSLKATGKAEAALTIVGPGLENKPTSATVNPGQSTDLIVPLKKGSYELYSPIGGDKASGKDVRITVN